MTEPRIRRLEARDLEGLVALCREHAAYERSTWAEFDRVPGLRELFLSDRDAFCWVVEDGGTLVGFASASLEVATWDAGRYLHLDCLFLRESHRGHGLGEALVEAVRERARAAGALRLEWQTPAWNEGAIRFYERLGATASEKLRFRLDP